MVDPDPVTGLLAEEDLRLLQAEHEGVPHAREVTFCGGRYPVTRISLVGLLRYASKKKGDSEQALMAAAHRVLEDCLDPSCWQDFQETAIRSKITGVQVGEVIQQIIEIHTAQPWRAALRLLAYAAANLAELDGNLLADTGRGLADLTPRQLCNIVMAKMLAGLDEEKRGEFLSDLYLDFDPESEAMKLVQQMIAAKEAQNGSG